jgi:hypothetical protein
MAQIKAEWRSEVSACTDRRAVEACVQSIQESAPARFAAVVEETSGFVLASLQRVSDSLQVLVVDEIRTKYEIARRASISDSGAPVIGEEVDTQLPPLDTGALDGAMSAFESRRVGYGLGGAAAGAVVGTLIAPGIGTAIGAFLGVFAGFLKGVESLKEDCITRLEACVDEGEKPLRAQLESREQGLAAALRGSLEDALDSAMSRFERSIAHLIDAERKTLAGERGKLARLAELRTALEAHEAWIAGLATSARPG